MKSALFLNLSSKLHIYKYIYILIVCLSWFTFFTNQRKSMPTDMTIQECDPPVKYFTDRSKAVLLLWIFYVFVLSCVCYVFVCVCLYVLCGHLLGKGWPLGSRLWCLLWVCHFPIGILGQVWYLIVSIPYFCILTYFYKSLPSTCFALLYNVLLICNTSVFCLKKQDIFFKNCVDFNFTHLINSYVLYT